MRRIFAASFLGLALTASSSFAGESSSGMVIAPDVEANPMMKAVTRSPIAFIGLKAGMATLSIMSAERMWKHGNRVGAVATMIASNVFMGYVASNNARVLSRVRQ